MSESETPTTKIKVEDKRRTSAASSAGDAAGTEVLDAEVVNPGADVEDPAQSSPGKTEASPEMSGDDAAEAPVRDFLDDLRRLQADFDNYRKRMVREQTALAARASARLVERLLPVLDSLDQAAAHGEGSSLAIVHDQLERVLVDEGLKEIEAENAPFDPKVHEAFEAHEDSSVDQPTVAKVLRRGYLLGDQVLRPAMVSVAQPADQAPSDAAEG